MLINELDRLRYAVRQVDKPVYDVVRTIMSDAITRRIRFRFMGTGVGRFSLNIIKNAFRNLVFTCVKHSATSTCRLGMVTRYARLDIGSFTGDAR